MENQKEESIKALESELKSLERSRSDLICDYISAQIHPQALVAGFIIVGCCGFYFGKVPLMMFAMAFYLFLHVFSIVYHGWNIARTTDEYEDLSRDIKAIECKIDKLENE